MVKTFDLPPATRRPIGVISVDALTLANLMSEVPVGAMITYGQLTSAIGRNVTEEARGVLDTARRKLQRDEKKVFGVIKGLGLKRLDDVETVQTGHAAISHIKRTAERSLERVMCPDHATLPPETQQAQLRFECIFKIHGHISSRKQLRKLDTAIKALQRIPDLNETLQFFAERRKRPAKRDPAMGGSKPELPPSTSKLQ
jgi:hypothetical protein